MLQLRYGASHPSVRRRSTAGALEALRDEGLVGEQAAASLLEHYRFLRRLEARLRLERNRPVEELGSDPAAVAPLAIRLGYDGTDPGRRLLDDYQRSREEVRRLYESIFLLQSGSH
jgi:glutamate-ammonia-ligase adenylyltransferase